ncbi:MAG TPA: FadD3 family acyl-CoA ligase [Acidimicrobiales bacterium]|nr:FadD3 family acyl-CoA ligase [Acidimicrobiales bacterium]
MTIDDASGPPATIPAVLRRAAGAFGADEAVVDGEVRWTWRDLAHRSDEVARALLASGVVPGDRVAVWAPNSAAWVALSFGVYSAGAVLVPINTRFKAEEAGHVLRTSGARLLFGVTELLGTDPLSSLDKGPRLDSLGERVVLAGPVPEGMVGWSEFLTRAGAASIEEVLAREAGIRGDSTSDIIFTSGTTGRPKGAELSHGASVRTYAIWSETVGLRHGDRYLVAYPFFHTAGLKSAILACALAGATIVPLAVFDVDEAMDLVVRERITMLPGPPTVFQSIWSHPRFETFDLSSLRLSVTGAASVPVEVVRRMREVMGFETVVTGYGLTETTGTVSMCRHDDPPEVIATTVGRPLPGVEVRIVGPDGPVGQGETGEIVVRGFNVMKGYFDDPVATAEAIDADGWLATGDIGHVDERGNLHITDRKKDMFIVGGFNAYPAEIEGIMLEHPSVAQVAVIGVPDERLGEVGLAFVVPRPGLELDPVDLLAWCAEHMANYKVPRSVRLIDALPLTPSGKVTKFALRDLLGL